MGWYEPQGRLSASQPHEGCRCWQWSCYLLPRVPRAALSLPAPTAQDAVPPRWGREVSRGCHPGPECLLEDREGRVRAGATSWQEDRQMQSRCLIIGTAFSDPWKSLHPNVDILREHTLLLRSAAVARCPQTSQPTFPWTVFRWGFVLVCSAGDGATVGPELGWREPPGTA